MTLKKMLYRTPNTKKTLNTELLIVMMNFGFRRDNEPFSPHFSAKRWEDLTEAKILYILVKISHCFSNFK